MSRIVVHDYSGHPFQIQLSRQLARMGYSVTHIYSADFQTPKGNLLPSDDFNGRLEILPLSLNSRFEKDTFFRRRNQEAAYGRLVGSRIRELKPDLVLSSNSPLDSQRAILTASKDAGSAFVFWVQDIYSEAILRILREKLGVFGYLIGIYYRYLEMTMLRRSNGVIVISNDFTSFLIAHHVDVSSIRVIQNWAPLDDLPYFPPLTASSLPVKVIYSGTLGYKHNIDLLLATADLPATDLLVYSEGKFAQELKRNAGQRTSIRVQNWVPASQLAGTLASGDILLAMIEADAGIFSVPSKILTYLCAGRPIVASVPSANLAARILRSSGAGLTSEPGDRHAFTRNIQRLTSDPQLRAEMGAAGRRYAETHFDIARIGADFEEFFQYLEVPVPKHESAATPQLNDA